MGLISWLIDTEFPFPAPNEEKIKPAGPFIALYSTVLAGFQPYPPQENQVEGLRNDLTQPFIGIEKSLEGLTCFAASFRKFAQGTHLATCAAYLVYGVAALIQGAILLVTTPLTWLYRIPLRALLTLFASYFDDNKPSTALKISSTLLVGSGVTALLWEGLQRGCPKLAHTAGKEITALLGQHALQILSYSMLGLASASLLGVLATLCFAENKSPTSGVGCLDA
jgi:hypothetical protein